MNSPNDSVFASSASYVALIPAAGVGSRMGSDVPKQYLDLLGIPILRRTVDVFAHHPAIDFVYVLVEPEDQRAQDILAGMSTKIKILYCGGQSRKDTVKNGLIAIADFVDGNDWILVHDAARALITAELLNRLMASLAQDEVGGLLALPVADTIKKCDKYGVSTISRENLWLAQTPQMFHCRTLLQALDNSKELTDEASAIEGLGQIPKLVLGHPRNLKITLPEDLQIAQAWIILERNLLVAS